MRPPAPLLPTDVLIMESTYGNRVHGDDDSMETLRTVVTETISRGGTLLIPSFAIGRAQEVLSLLAELRLSGEIQDVPIYVNSPMAIDATELFLKYQDEHRLTANQCRRMSQHVHYVRSVEASKALTHDENPKIVISASGMATGGRVLRHLAQLAPNPRNTLMFVGYQAPGTRGRAIVSGESHVRLFGVDVPIRARVEHMMSLSAHADSMELLAWAGSSSTAPTKTFLNHGELDASIALRELLEQRLGWSVEIPNFGDSIDTSSLLSQDQSLEMRI
jgi:metallo-beta-lactamase family protein